MGVEYLWRGETDTVKISHALSPDTNRLLILVSVPSPISHIRAWWITGTVEIIGTLTWACQKVHFWIFMNEIKSLVCNNDLFYAEQSTTTQAIMLSIHFHHYYLYPSLQSKEAGIKTLVALDDQGGKTKWNCLQWTWKIIPIALMFPHFLGVRQNLSAIVCKSEDEMLWLTSGCCEYVKKKIFCSSSTTQVFQSKAVWWLQNSSIT